MTTIERYSPASASGAITEARVRLLSSLHQQRLARIVNRSISIVEEVNAGLAQAERLTPHRRARAIRKIEDYIDASCRALARL